MPASSRVRDCAAIGGDHERGPHAALVRELEPHVLGRHLELLETGAQHRRLAHVRRLDQRPLQPQVLDDRAEIGLAGLRRRKAQRIGGVVAARGIPHHHVGVRCRVGLDRGPCARGLQDALRCARDRGHAQVDATCVGRARLVALDQGHAPLRGPLVRRQQPGDGRADDAATDDRDVEIDATLRGHLSGPVRRAALRAPGAARGRRRRR